MLLFWEYEAISKIIAEEEQLREIVCVFWQKVIPHLQEFARALSSSQTHLFVLLTKANEEENVSLLKVQTTTINQVSISTLFVFQMVSKNTLLHLFLCVYILFCGVTQRVLSKKKFINLDVSIYFFISQEKWTLLLSLNCFLAAITKILEMNLLFHCLRN